MSWSWVYTECSIHRLNHRPKTVCVPFILMITRWHLIVASASRVPPYTIDRNPTSSPSELKDKVTLSQSHGCELTNWWNVSQHPARLCINCRQVTIQTCSITSSMFAWSCRSSACPTSLDSATKFPWSWPPTACPISLNYGFHTRLITASTWISKLAELLPPRVQTAWSRPPSSHDHCHQIHISILAGSRPPSASPHLLHYGLQVRMIMSSRCNLQSHSITTSECIPEFTWSSFPGAPRIALKHRLQQVQIYCL